MQLLVATTAVSAGLRAPLTGLPSIDAGLTVFWIVAVVNALNFMDVCDGLVAGTSVIFLFGAGLIVGGVPVWWAFSGAAAGFLLYNRPRASIFLGDAGSHFFGFLAAAVGIQIVQSQGNWPGLLSLGLLLVLPLFELVYVTGVRVANGDPIWKGSGDHVALRLQHAGLSSWKTIGLMWSLGLVGAVAATRVAGLGEGGQSALAAGSILVLALFAFLISRCPPPPPETKSGSQDRGATPSEPPQID